MKKYNYHGDLVTATFEKYLHGGIRIQLWDEDGPFLTASTHLPGLEENEVAVKDYSENYGMYEFLLANKIIKPAHRYMTNSWVTFPICRLEEH